MELMKHVPLFSNDDVSPHTTPATKLTRLLIACLVSQPALAVPDPKRLVESD
jgi:hypothetical protein